MKFGPGPFSLFQAGIGVHAVLLYLELLMTGVHALAHSVLIFICLCLCFRLEPDDMKFGPGPFSLFQAGIGIHAVLLYLELLMTGVHTLAYSGLIFICLCLCFRLEPLLSRISEKRSAVVCPEIDVISAQTLAYSGVGGRSVGGFWWSLHFSWRPMPAREEKRRKSPTDPIRYRPATLTDLIS